LEVAAVFWFTKHNLNSQGLRDVPKTNNSLRKQNRVKRAKRASLVKNKPLPRAYLAAFLGAFVCWVDT
jgi:hypothetical protein